MSERKNNIVENIKSISGKAANPEASLRAVGFLFPAFAHKIGTTIVSTSAKVGEVKLERRISVLRYAHQYFTLTPDVVAWSKAAIEDVLSSPDPVDALISAWKRIESAPQEERRGLRGDLLNALEAAFDSRLQLNERWFVAILNISVNFIFEQDIDVGSFYSFDNGDRIRWLLVKAWTPLEIEEKERIFEFVVDAIVDYSMLCEFFRSTYGDMTATGAKKSEVSEAERMFEINARASLLSKVRELARSGEIWRQADLAAVLWFWWGCDCESEVQHFTNLGMRNLDSALALMRASIGFVLSTAGSYERVDRTSWSRIYDIDALREIAIGLKRAATGNAYDVAERYLIAFDNYKER